MSTENSPAAPTEVQYFSANPNAPNAHIYTAAVAYGNLLFLAGKTSWAAPEPNDIRSAAKYVLDQIEKELVNAGSSMQKVLRVTVYLRNIEDWDALNEVYVGRFGAKPPARTTIAAILPRESLVEMDAVAII
jgi:2-iminobutanoate/2-iminopropanoate deaminase